MNQRIPKNVGGHPWLDANHVIDPCPLLIAMNTRYIHACTPLVLYFKAIYNYIALEVTQEGGPSDVDMLDWLVKVP